MKHLKHFNELKSYTYRTASDKLKKLGHSKRSAALMDWSDKTKIKEEENQRKERFNLWSNYGIWDMTIANSMYDRAAKKGYYQFITSGKFVISLNLETDWADERINDWPNENFYLSFGLGMAPADEETEKNITNLDKKNSDLVYNKALWPQWYDIKLSKDVNIDGASYEKIIKPEGVYSISYNDGVVALFDNRQNTFKFRKLLIDIFEGRVKMITDKNCVDMLTQTKNVFDKMQDRGIIKSSKESFDEFVLSIRKMSLNNLYKEDIV